MKQTVRTKTMVEAALLVSLATVLSIFKIVELPYGGSITFASMLPIILLSYRHGLRWGLGGAAVHALLQQLLGLNNLTFFTTWQSVLAIIVLDYVLAFTLVGLGGVFRRVVRLQALSLALGAITVSVLRYLCHVISGATVWAGLSIPTEAALFYSLGYNATYMLPECIVLTAAAWYLGTVIDFRKERPVRLVTKGQDDPAAHLLGLFAGLVCFGGLVADVSLVFSRLQNAQSGEFDITGLAAPSFAQSIWLPVTVVSASCALLAAVLLILRCQALAKEAEKR